MTLDGIHVNLLWCAAGRVGGSEEYLVRQLVGLPDGMNVTLHLGRVLAESRPELARHRREVARANVDRRIIRIPVEHTVLAAATRRASVVHHGGGTMPGLRPRVPTVLTIHDLQYRRFPHYFSTARRAYLQAVMPRSARSATVIATPTAHVADDVAESFGIDRSRIVVVPHGIPSVNVSDEVVAEIRRSHLGEGEGRLIVYPAITHPHKGHQLLLEAMARWPEKSDRLVLIGGVGSAEAQVQADITRLGLDDRVLRLGRVPGPERDALIAAADLIVFPSEEEGFGAPVMEAMAAGTPVIASRIGALSEVVGEAGVVVDREPDAFVDAMKRVLADPDPWVQQGLERSAQFSIEASGLALMEAYREAMERGGR